MRSNQRGSAHAIIVACIVVVLLGALGYVFWAHYIQKPVRSSHGKTMAVQSKVDTPPPSTKKAFCTSVEKVCFSYPSDWNVRGTVVQRPDSGDTSDLVTITDDTNMKVATIDTGVYGIGGSCDLTKPDEISTVSVIASVATTVRVVPDIATQVGTVYAVESIVQNENGYLPYIYLSDNKDDATKHSYRTCFPGYAALYNAKNSKGLVEATNVDLLSYNENAPYYPSSEAAMKAFSSATSIKVYELFRSFHY